MKERILAKHKELILQLISKDTPKARISRQLGCDIKTLNTYLRSIGVVYHGNQSGLGFKKYQQRDDYVPYERYIKECSVHSNKLRRKLLREGLKDYKCESCGNTQWLDRDIPLEVHHKNGDKNDNTLENLQLLCPNCHAMTDTYRGRNVRRRRIYAEVSEMA
jgi:5-methylcytosine-specific restriction endonuclease McrA